MKPTDPTIGKQTARGTIQDNRFVTLHAWIVTRLGLTANEAIVYALIYGYKDGFSHSIAHIALWLNCSERTVQRILQHLVMAGYIDEKKQNGKATTYTCRPLTDCRPRQIVAPDKLSTVPRQIVAPDTLYIDNSYNNIIERDNNKAHPEKQKKFQRPTIEEVEQYCAQRHNGINAEEFYYFYESKGWLVGKTPMKNWQAAVISWEKIRKKEKSNG